MTSGIKFTPAQNESIDQFGREHSDKLQSLGRALVSGLYMLIRSVRMYNPENTVFQKPLSSLLEVIRQILAKDGKLELVGVKDSFYLNNMLLKIDLNAIDNVRYLLAELQAKDVGGVTFDGSVELKDLKRFIGIFSQEHPIAGEDGLQGKKLVNVRLAKWSALKEKLQGDALNALGDEKVDRKKYAMTLYARAVFFLEHYLESVRAGKPISTSKAMRIVQDLVDISYEHRTHFLGMTTLKSEADYLVHHQVNVCVMSIVFGYELGLTKPQLRDLGYAALFHDAGMTTVPEEVSQKHGSLTVEERDLVQRAPMVSVRNILIERNVTRTTLQRVVTTYEHKQDYGTPIRDLRGNIQLIVPKTDLGVYSRILAICDHYDALTSKRPYRDAYSPEVALLLMWTEMRQKFDPELLQVFMKVMAVAPVKILPKHQQTIMP